MRRSIRVTIALILSFALAGASLFIAYSVFLSVKFDRLSQIFITERGCGSTAERLSIVSQIVDNSTIYIAIRGMINDNRIEIFNCQVEVFEKRGFESPRLELLFVKDIAIPDRPDENCKMPLRKKINGKMLLLPDSGTVKFCIRSSNFQRQFGVYGYQIIYFPVKKRNVEFSTLPSSLYDYDVSNKTNVSSYFSVKDISAQAMKQFWLFVLGAVLGAAMSAMVGLLVGSR